MKELLHYLLLSSILNVSILGLSIIMNPVHASITYSNCNITQSGKTCDSYSLDTYDPHVVDITYENDNYVNHDIDHNSTNTYNSFNEDNDENN